MVNSVKEQTYRLPPFAQEQWMPDGAPGTLTQSPTHSACQTVPDLAKPFKEGRARDHLGNIAALRSSNLTHHAGHL